VENVGVYRLQVKGRNRLGIQTVPQHDIAIHLAHAEARGEDLPVAIALGNEPIITLMAATPMLYDQLEYKMAAVMQGRPYRVVKTAKGLDIPWGSEYVLEGRILARQRGRSANSQGITRVVTNIPLSRSSASRIARIRSTIQYMSDGRGPSLISYRR
jgi:UbiD family decarboxylase